MQSYQPSRGRIFFEVLCAFGMSASLAGAWVQTGAIALAAGASIAALYGLVHFFDLFRRKQVVEVEPQRIDFDTRLEIEPIPTFEEDRLARPPMELQPVVDIVGIEELSVPETTPVAPESQPAKAGRRAKAPSKGGGRRAKAPKEAESSLTPAPEDEGDVTELPDPSPVSFEPPAHSTVTPLFEPEPFSRQPHRAMFGRKVR